MVIVDATRVDNYNYTGQLMFLSRNHRSIAQENSSRYLSQAYAIANDHSLILTAVLEIAVIDIGPSEFAEISYSVFTLMQRTLSSLMLHPISFIYVGELSFYLKNAICEND